MMVASGHPLQEAFYSITQPRGNGYTDTSIQRRPEWDIYSRIGRIRHYVDEKVAEHKIEHSPLDVRIGHNHVRHRRHH